MKRFLTCVSTALTLCLYTYGQQRVHITGVSQDTTAGFIRFNNDFPLWRDFNKAMSFQELEKKDLSYSLDLPLAAPEVRRLMLIGGTYDMYLTPGDEVSFVLTKEGNNRYPAFSGKNAANYNYDVERQRKYKLESQIPSYRAQEPVDSFKLRLNTWYDGQHAFLEEYNRQQPLTKGAYLYFSRELEYKYMFGLYSPLTRGVQAKDLPARYLTDIKGKADMKQLPQESVYSIPAFIYRHILYNVGQPSDLGSTYAYILKNFTGRTRQAMVANLIGVFSRVQRDTYADTLANIMAAAPRYVKDSIYVDYVNRSYTEYQYLNKPLPQEVLTNTMLKDYKDGRTISLGQLLEENKGRPVYINFWASWCGACREDHNNAEKADAYLAEKEVVQIFISIDKQNSEAAWRKAAEDDKRTVNQYLAEGDYKSPVVTTFRINAIPRHFFLDKAHQVKSVNAVRPTTANLMDLKMSVEPVLGKVVRFN